MSVTNDFNLVVVYLVMEGIFIEEEVVAIGKIDSTVGARILYSDGTIFLRGFVKNLAGVVVARQSYWYVTTGFFAI